MKYWQSIGRSVLCNNMIEIWLRKLSRKTLSMNTKWNSKEILRDYLHVNNQFPPRLAWEVIILKASSDLVLNGLNHAVSIAAQISSVWKVKFLHSVWSRKKSRRWLYAEHLVESALDLYLNGSVIKLMKWLALYLRLIIIRKYLELATEEIRKNPESR